MFAACKQTFSVKATKISLFNCARKTEQKKLKQTKIQVNETAQIPRFQS